MDQVSHFSPSVFLCFPCISVSSSRLPPLQSGWRRQSPRCLRGLAGQGGCPCCGMTVGIRGTIKASGKATRKKSTLPRESNGRGYGYSPSLCLYSLSLWEERSISRITPICPITPPHPLPPVPHRSPLTGLSRCYKCHRNLPEGF